MLPLPWEGVNAIAFVDAGELRVKDPTPGQHGRIGLASFGLGLRWSIARRFYLSLDVAQVIDGAIITQAGERRGHLNLVYKF